MTAVSKMNGLDTRLALTMQVWMFQKVQFFCNLHALQGEQQALKEPRKCKWTPVSCLPATCTKQHIVYHRCCVHIIYHQFCVSYLFLSSSCCLPVDEHTISQVTSRRSIHVQQASPTNRTKKLAKGQLSRNRLTPPSRTAHMPSTHPNGRIKDDSRSMISQKLIAHTF